MDRISRLYLVFCIYGLLLWGYVVALQVRKENWVYGVLATWVPIRLDYWRNQFRIFILLRHSTRSETEQA